MSKKTYSEDGCPERKGKPERWEFVKDDKWRQTDRMKCKVCGSVFDIDSSIKGSGVIYN